MLKELNITELKPHPMNEQLFDDIEGEKWEEFLTSVQEHGVMTPLVITEDGTIISGHQRLRACQALNISTVLCRVIPLKTDDDILLALIESNIRQRGVINSPTVKLGRMISEMERIMGAGDREGGGKVGRGKLSRKAIRDHIGVDNSVAKCAKAIAKMPEEMQNLVEQEAITPRTAYDLVCKLTPEEQVELAKKLDPVQKYTQSEIKAAIERFFPKAQELEEMQQRLAEYQQNDGELELRQKLRDAQAEVRTTYEDLQAEKRQRKKERAEFEKRMDAMEQLLEDSGGSAPEIARLTEERDQYMHDADAAQNDADMQLVISLISTLSSALSEVANDPRPLTGDLVDAAQSAIAQLEVKLDAIKSRIQTDSAA